MKPEYHRLETVTLKTGAQATITEYPKRVAYNSRKTLGNYAYNVKSAGAEFTVGEKEIAGAVTPQREGV